MPRLDLRLRLEQNPHDKRFRLFELETSEEVTADTLVEWMLAKGEKYVSLSLQSRKPTKFELMG